MTRSIANKADLVYRLIRETDRGLSVLTRGTTKSNGFESLNMLSYRMLERAYTILNMLERLIRLKDYSNILQKSREYYRLVPRYLTSREKKSTSWVLDTYGKINKEREAIYLFTLMRERFCLVMNANKVGKYLPANLYVENNEQSFNEINRLLKLDNESRVKVKNIFSLSDYRGGNDPKGYLFIPLKHYMVLGSIETITNDVYALNFNRLFFGRGRPNKVKIYKAEEAIKQSLTSWYGREPLNKTGYILVCGCSGLLNSDTTKSLGIKNELVSYNPSEIWVKYLVEVEKQ